MIELAGSMDYVWLILIAAGMGAIGGLVAELLRKRRGATDTIEVPHSLSQTLVEAGVFASMLIGAVAAVAILYFFPPVVERTVTSTTGKVLRTKSEYDLVKLVALSLIVGTGGRSFLAASQARVMSALNAQKAETAVKASRKQLDQVAASAKAAVPGAVREAMSAQGVPADERTVAAVAKKATESLDNTLKPQIQAAHEQMSTLDVSPG